MQRSTILFGAVWACVAMVIIWQLPERAVELATISLVYPVFYTGASIYGQVQRRRTVGTA